MPDSIPLRRNACKYVRIGYIRTLVEETRRNRVAKERGAHPPAPRRAGEKDSSSPISVFHFFFPRQGYREREPASFSLSVSITLPSSLFSAALLSSRALLFLYLPPA